MPTSGAEAEEEDESKRAAVQPVLNAKFKIINAKLWYAFGIIKNVGNADTTILNFQFCIMNFITRYCL